MGFLNKVVVGTAASTNTNKQMRGDVVNRLNQAAANKAERDRVAAEQAQIKANEGSIQHGKLMGSIAEKAAAEGAARDLGSTPEASADVAIGGSSEDSAIDTAAGRSKRKRQVFSSGGSSGVNI